jgi:hypothetical protein
VRFETDEKMTDRSAITSEGILSFFGRELRDFALVDLFSFPNAKTWHHTLEDFLQLLRARRDSPIALRKFSINASVFLTSVEKISLPTIGQNGTLVPSSCDTASARAVLPVPGPPARSTALPDIFLDFMRSTTTPHA